MEGKKKEKIIKRNFVYRMENLHRREKRGGPSNTLLAIYTSGHNTCPEKKRALNIPTGFLSLSLSLYVMAHTENITN
jgi:hypothetical protein